MPQILYLPKPIPLSTTGGLMAGAKLYTYQTGTSTPQSVYSDYTLTTPHANPVVADGNGVFPVMYWGNTTRYRLTLKTSADVTLSGYPVDDCGPDTATGLGVPTLASSNVFTGTTNKLSSSEVRLILDETDAGTDKRLWDVDIQAGVLKLRTRTDADGSGVDVLTVTRGSATAVSSIDINGALTTTGTGTLTGCTTTPTITVHFTKVGRIVTAYCSGIEATSNSTSCSLTGAVAAGLQPLQSQTFSVPIRDNTAYETGIVQLSPGSSTISIFRYGATNFTAAGTKGLPYGFSIAWSID